jgi:DNA-binding LacI/PurR family transcriptional regulator
LNSPKAGRQPVIADVARLAGVSVPTVSRVLTGAARVSEERHERVMAAIVELGFRPSAAARTLATGRARIIAVLTGNTSRYGYAETIRGIEERSREDGYTVMITVVESTDDDEVDRAIDLVVNQSVAGVVVLKFDPPGVAALHRLPPGLPAVSVSGIREPGVPQAVLDEAAASREATEYLLDLGHATVHHVRVPPSREEDGRTTGWSDALRARGIPVPSPHDATWSPESGRVIGLRLAADRTVTAVFCGNDEIAMGVMRGIIDGGRRVPEDVSVIGFDDHPLAAMWSPPLTTVRQDFGALGGRAYGILADRLRGLEVPAFSSDNVTLVLRQSCAPPAHDRDGPA